MALTIRTTKEQDKQIATLCNQLNIKTSTKLFIYLLETFEPTSNKLKALNEEIKQLSIESDRRDKIVSNYQDSLTDLLNIRAGR